MCDLSTNRRSPGRDRLVAVATVALLALVVAACGWDDDPGTGSATTPTARTQAGDEPDRSADDDTDELAAEDVPAYVAAHEEALATSALQVGDGRPRPIDRAEFLDGITVRSGDDTVDFVLDGDGIAEVVARLDGEAWVADDPEVLDQLVSAFDSIEPGDVWEAAFTVVGAADPTATRTVTMRLDTDLIGGGDSTVEVVDGYATISGVLGTETYGQLRDAIEANPEIDTLVMLSVEGSENDAINLHTSRLIRQAGWTTWLPANGDISSGGVDMFLAGRERVIEPGGFLGVHSWGSSDGDVVAAELPEDHPAHRAQLAYVTEMLGPDVGPDFYFYTLDAAPAASIHRMTDDEVETYGLATRRATTAIPTSITGPPAGYLQLVDQVYLKHRVLACEIDGESVVARLESDELGRVDLLATAGEGQLTWSDLPPGPTAAHPVTGVSIDGDHLTVDADLDLDDLIGRDTGRADFAIDCGP